MRLRVGAVWAVALFLGADCADKGGGSRTGGDAQKPPADHPDIPRRAVMEPSSPWKWGLVQKDGCQGEGLRQLSAPLKNIPTGMSPTAACQRAPRNVMGIPFAHPDRCVDDDGMRGQWDVPDSSCRATPAPAPTRGGEGALSSKQPLEGIADIHLHQMANLGFGGTIVWGGAYGPPEQVLLPIPQAMKWGHDRSEAFFKNDILGGISGVVTHSETGYPTFTTWPNREHPTHQQAYEDWLFRAYQGGLRLMVMLAVNSEDMFGRGENDIPVLGNISVQSERLPGRSTNDMETLEWQIREAYRMQADVDRRAGGPGRGWYRIVRDPDEASAVVAQGKLAVILGTELQHLFNCDADRPPCTEETIVEGLDRLEAMGVNYVFPIHHKLNQFGGPAQFNPLTNGPTQECFETKEACSSAGLTPLGKFLVEELTTRGMFIDTDHMSWRAFDDAIRIAEQRSYPVMAGHVGAFDLKADGDVNEQTRRTDQLQRILNVGGMLGIITSVSADEYSPSKTTPVRVPISCGGTDHWANAYLYMRDLASGGLAGSAGRIAIGTDWNGFSSWPSPRYEASPCAPPNAKDGKPTAKPARVTYPLTLPAQLLPAAIQGVSSMPRFEEFHPWDWNELGLMHAGLEPEFLEDLRLLGLTLAELEPLYRSARGVVETWRLARDREVSGDRHHLRWVPRSPFDVLTFDYADPTRNVEVVAGLTICRTRTGHRLGFEKDGACHPVDGGDLPSLTGELPPVSIAAYHAGRCLDVTGGATTDGTAVRQYTCHETDNQHWKLRSSDGQGFQIINRQSDKCLALSDGSPQPGATTVQQTCDGRAEQAWWPVRTGNTFSLRPAKGSNLCLEVSGQSRADGAPVALAACDGAAYQQWSIDSLRAADYERLYQADKDRTAWLSSGDGAHPIEISADDVHAICRSRDAAPWLGVIMGDSCVGRLATGGNATTASFDRLFQAR